MDVKKIGRIPDGGGWRIHGREGIARSPLAKIGYYYVHSLVDDHSRLAYSEILPDEKGQTCADFAPPRRRLLPHPRHHQDRTADDRQRLGIQVLPAHRMRQAQHPPGVHQSALPMAERESGATQIQLCNRSGPTARCSPPMPNEQQPLHPGSSTTTLDDATARSVTSHPSAGCYQPDDRVHLGAESDDADVCSRAAPAGSRRAGTRASAPR